MGELADVLLDAGVFRELGDVRLPENEVIGEVVAGLAEGFELLLGQHGVVVGAALLFRHVEVGPTLRVKAGPRPIEELAGFTQRMRETDTADVAAGKVLAHAVAGGGESFQPLIEFQMLGLVPLSHGSSSGMRVANTCAR
ncbi:MAG: hypothetical protein H7Z40_22920, partial [Phycisphaerae bacterium]|nr:hypothetical protein [Gemmatimonadaceae bacterium]